MRVGHPVMLVSLLIAVSLGCGGGQGRQQPSAPPRRIGVVDLTISDASSTGSTEGFGRISGLALDADGRIIVADGQDQVVRVFSAGGELLYSVGRAGKGPGEFAEPCCVTMAKDGLLWVKENGNRRYSAFRLGQMEATFVRSIPGTTNIAGSDDRVTFDATGLLIDLETDFDASNGLFRIARRHLDSAGAVQSRDLMPNPPQDSLDNVSVTTRNSTTEFTQPYGATELHAYGNDGDMAHAVSSNYAVSWVTNDGTRRALLKRTLDAPVPLSAEERKGVDSRIDRMARGSGIPRAQLPLKVPATKMPLKSLGFDLDGRLWVERSVQDGQPGEADLYDKTGAWTAIMQWPADISMSQTCVRGTTGLGVRTDEDGVQSVVRLQFN